MPTFFTLHPLDIAAIVSYFVAVMAIGFWASRRVKDEKDFFMGGRRFGKGLLVMHWLCTGTHSEMAVQVAGATARVGLGGIWYQWMYLFSTPFYWMIAPVTRRLRVLTTGDFFRIRYGRALEMLYSVVALFYFAQSIATLLRGAGEAISGATGGQIPTQASVIVLAVLFSTYIMAGGLVAAAYTDFLQGVMIIALSVMLVPAGLACIGGLEGLHAGLPAEMFAITAPAGSNEGDPWAVVALSVLGLVGIVVQPHVMSATGSGKTETEARVGMCYGNFIKRLLTIAWAFTGLIALVYFSEAPSTGPAGLEVGASEKLFGQSVREFLPVGWRGLMIACLIAGVTGAETFMVVASAIFTRNFYVHIVRNRSEAHYLWFGRCASAGMLALSIVLAFYAESVNQLFVNSIKIIGLLGASFWLGVTWRRANAAGVWASVMGGAFVWGLSSWATSVGPAGDMVPSWTAHIAHWSEPVRVLATLAVQFGALIVVSLLTRRPAAERLDPFFARLLTPVGREHEVLLATQAVELPESATLGMEGVLLDYRKASRFGYAGLRRLGIELPRLTRFDCVGFLAAWGLVVMLITLLYWLAGLGA
ncbi:MAG TPA: sodium:solute symporter family protein [Pirellulales bacterium]|nr:sodium:solute symporter family protein [Pirellulales bacterium]